MVEPRQQSMLAALRSRIDIVNAAIASGVWLTVFIVYNLTKAPTVSFWDCGEFIAASHILGIPHPPGSPLYIILGRLFSILPLAADPSVRVNLLSVLPSTFTALFGYLSAVRILRVVTYADRSLLTRVLVYAGSAAGALFLAFGLTNWNNSVEAEVYGLAMMMLMSIFWLALVYRDHPDDAFGQRVLLLIFFIAFAGIGVHMTAFLIMPAVGLILILKKETPSNIWLAVGAWLLFELYLVFAMSSMPDEIPYYIPVTITLIVYLFYIFSYEKVPSVYLYTAGGFLLAVLPLAGHAVKALMDPSRTASAHSTFAVLSIIGSAAFIGLLVVAAYLAYRYRQQRKQSVENMHDLVAAAFILAAGVMTGITVLNIRGYGLFLVATALLGLVFVALFLKYIRWPMLIALAAVSMVILGVHEMFLALLIAAVAIPIVGLLFKQPGWKNAMLVLLVAVMGYSVHVFIPIRSAQQPVINENNPSQSLPATINFIERKQYGSQSMVERMFKRRGEWENQFGNWRRMGFWGFFSEQYGTDGLRFIIFFVIGLYGIWEVLRRRADLGVPLMVLLLLASVGLVLYMNFADGTRQHPVTGADYIEVRNRDYFFTPAFLVFGLGVGMGLAGIVQFVRESTARLSPILRKGVVTACLVLFALPAYPLAKNWHVTDRSNNYMAFDYGWNILISSEPNAVLITGGDNDTFPLWCLQEVYGIRKDVDVVNLSLANAKWYIKQLKSTLGIPMSWSEEDIDSLFVFRDQFGNIHRLQNQVVAEIINTNYKRRPINFANTIAQSSRTYMGRSLDSLLTLQGMVWRLDRDQGDKYQVDIEACLDLFTYPGRFRYRGIADPGVYKNETALRLTRQYIAGFLLVADSLRRAGQMPEVEALVEAAVERIPYSEEGINYLANVLADVGNRARLKELAESTQYGDRQWLRLMMARLERRMGDYQAAADILEQTLIDYPTYRPGLEELIRLYTELRRPEMVPPAVRQWLKHNPDDMNMRALLANFERELERIDSIEDIEQ